MRPSFSTSSFSPWTIRSPRFTRASELKPPPALAHGLQRDLVVDACHDTSPFFGLEFPTPAGTDGGAVAVLEMARPCALRTLLRYPALAMALLALALHLYASGGYRYFCDALSFIVGGTRPVWGYVDRPPPVPPTADWPRLRNYR